MVVGGRMRLHLLEGRDFFYKEEMSLLSIYLLMQLFVYIGLDPYLFHALGLSEHSVGVFRQPPPSGPMP